MDCVDLIEMQTALGPIHLHGRDTGKPVLVLITGAFATANTADRLDRCFPAIDVFRAHLPGNHCPPVAQTSVGVFAGAFTEALDRRFAGRPMVVVGLSVGGLVALAIRAKALRGVLAVEPVLVTDEAWPLENLRSQAPPGNEDFLWNVLGVGPDSIERRDYRPLLDALTVPTLVLLGDEVPPYGEWPEYMPGLLGALSRQALTERPAIAVTQLSGVGHHILRHDPYAFLEATRRVVERGLGPEAATLRLG